MKALNKETAPKTQRPERIIQFGEGNFLRAFVDWIIYNMNQKADFNSSVVVVQPIDKGMVDMLNAQDDLYHVNLQGLDKGEAVNSLTMIDVISRALNPYTQNDEFMKLAEQPEMRFVISNTTEAGIAFDPACKLEDAPASSYPGKLTQLLYHRFKTFNGDKTKGLIIFPCELIFLNGHKLKETIYQYIELWNLGNEFKTWFEEACGVYATLVDRIVPGFPRKDIAAIKEKLQYDDNLVVQAEVFHLWVIEAPQEVAKEFPADKAGLNVLFVPSEAAASGGNFDCLHKSVSLFSEKPNKIAAILPRKQVCFSASSIAAWESVPFIMLIYGIKYKFTRKFQANFISVFAISTYLCVFFMKKPLWRSVPGSGRQGAGCHPPQ